MLPRPPIAQLEADQRRDNPQASDANASMLMTFDVACLCAAWCRTCESYRSVFEQVLHGLGETRPIRRHWIDIEDETELLGDRIWRSSSACNNERLTGSPSNAMLRATFCGRPCSRSRCCCSGVSARQRWMASIQFMPRIVRFWQVADKPLSATDTAADRLTPRSY